MAVSLPDARYVVVLTALSDARFAEDEVLEIVGFPTPVGAATFRFQTRFEDRGFEDNVPTDVWIEVSGTSSSSLNQAIEAYANTALGFVPLIALAANAWIDDVEIRLAFEDTPGRREREFMQSFTSPLEPEAIRFGRPVDCEGAFALVHTVAHHAERNRLRRAAAQYRLALSQWTNGHETLAIAHLWIAVEALTKIALRRELQTAGRATPQELADAWGVRLQDLDGEVRRRAIFRGDADATAKARRASDGFEHGYLDFGEIRQLSGATRDSTARYVRQAIFEFADLSQPWRSRLLDARYATPLKSWIVRYLRGKLVGDSDDLAALDEAYPIFTWTRTPKTISLRPDGSYYFEMEENYRASLSDAVHFQRTSLEVWGAREETVGADAGQLEVGDGAEDEMPYEGETR